MSARVDREVLRAREQARVSSYLSNRSVQNQWCWGERLVRTGQRQRVSDKLGCVQGL